MKNYIIPSIVISAFYLVLSTFYLFYVDSSSYEDGASYWEEQYQKVMTEKETVIEQNEELQEVISDIGGAVGSCIIDAESGTTYQDFFTCVENTQAIIYKYY